jgi:hypothetical protein
MPVWKHPDHGRQATMEIHTLGRNGLAVSVLGL